MSPVLLVHAGNRVDAADRPSPRFPASRVADVRARVARLLEALAPDAVVSGGAAGADLIVVGEAERMGVPVHLVLAAPAAEFRAASVADQGASWVQQFDRALAAAASVAVAAPVPGTDPFLRANDVLVDRALELADGRAVLGLTIRPPGGEGPLGVTDDFALRAEARGIVVVDLDPLRSPTNGAASLP